MFETKELDESFFKKLFTTKSVDQK